MFALVLPYPLQLVKNLTKHCQFFVVVVVVVVVVVDVTILGGGI